MFSKKVHRNIFLFGIVSAPLGVLIGRAPGSWPIIILGANWLLEGQFLLKWQRYKTNPVFLTLISLFVLTVLGLMYTQDMGSGINEFRIDLPLIVLPLAIFSGESFSKKELRFVLYSLVLGCFLSSLWCLLYGFVIHHIEEGRNLSRFMSHIRFGMYINLAIATCIYLFLKSHRIFQKIAWFILAIYFLISMLMMGLASGLIVFCVLLFLVLIYSIYKQTFKYKILGFAGLAALLLISVRYTLNISKQQLEVLDSSYNQLKSANAKGKTYMHFDSLGVLENGNYVFRNIQLQDLRTAWNKRVPEDTFSYNPQHNLKRYDVLLRYLSSAALSKDEEGVLALSNEDIHHIQNNITNRYFPQWSFLHKRVYELVNDYDDFKHQRDLNGHSLAMRLIFWEASWQLISENLWFGVGTGDVQQTLNNIYENKFKQLNKNFYLKPHNQFLSITLAFGLTGLLLFLFVLFFPVYYLRGYLSRLYWVFLFILLISFITEDTLGSQAGLNFYCIFNVVFCAEAYFKKQQTLVDSQASH